jgi:protein-S-isoprenylcysteine O-methyltransferase Ste14
MDPTLRTVSILGFLMKITALAILAYDHAVFADGPIGIGVQIASALFMVWARITFGRRSFHAGANTTDGGLVTTGPYAIVRNPIYTAILGFIWAACLSHTAPLHWLAGALATVGTAIRIYCEERFLREHYPDYPAYAAKVKRVIPFIL